jgi:hypothetical protein
MRYFRDIPKQANYPRSLVSRCNTSTKKNVIVVRVLINGILRSMLVSISIHAFNNNAQNVLCNTMKNIAQFLAISCWRLGSSLLLHCSALMLAVAIGLSHAYCPGLICQHKRKHIQFILIAVGAATVAIATTTRRRRVAGLSAHESRSSSESGNTIMMMSIFALADVLLSTKYWPNSRFLV